MVGVGITREELLRGLDLQVCNEYMERETLSVGYNMFFLICMSMSYLHVEVLFVC